MLVHVWIMDREALQPTHRTWVSGNFLTSVFLYCITPNSRWNGTTVHSISSHIFRWLKLSARSTDLPFCRVHRPSSIVPIHFTIPQLTPESPIKFLMFAINRLLQPAWHRPLPSTIYFQHAIGKRREQNAHSPPFKLTGRKIRNGGIRPWQSNVFERAKHDAM